MSNENQNQTLGNIANPENQGNPEQQQNVENAGVVVPPVNPAGGNGGDNAAQANPPSDNDSFVIRRGEDGAFKFDELLNMPQALGR